MTRPLRLLLIEDSEQDAELLLAELEDGGFAVKHVRVESAEATMDALATGTWDIVISDYTLPQLSGLEVIEIVRKHDPNLPVIITSGNIGEDIAVEAMRAGAHDYLMKNNLSRLTPAIDRELRESMQRQNARQMQRRFEDNEAQFRAIVSNVPGMVFQLECGPQGALRFSYVSEGSKRLFGLTPQQLQRDCALFFDRLIDYQQSPLMERIMSPGSPPQFLNWEGRIHSLSGEADRWLEIRMSRRHSESAAMQWFGIIEDISQRKKIELELLQSQSQLSALSSHLQKIKEEERTSIAREVHDNIGGNLTAIKIDLLWLINRISNTDVEALKKMQSLELLADRTMAITSRIARDLRPPLLDLGLLAAVEWEAAEFGKRMAIPCTVQCNGDDITMEPGLANALFSIFREALTNISKHAGATQVGIKLEDDGTVCTLQVTDNGRGFTQIDLLKAQSFGLRGMLERARNLGGEISFSGGPGTGMTVTARLPLHARAPLSESIDNTGNP